MPNIKNSFSAPAILLCLLLITVFGVTLLPASWYSPVYKTLLILTVIIIIFSLESKYRKLAIYLVSISLLLFTLTFVIDFSALDIASKLLNAVFFGLTVLQLMAQISRSRIVSSPVIIQAVNGYLLLGLVFSIFLSGIVELRPASFSFSETGDGHLFSNFYNHLYFGFVTMGTVGFGDIVPKTPFAKSFTTLIGVTGQLYIALVIALLVGKYSSQTRSQN